MGSPAIFSGRRTKLLTADGILTKEGRTLDYDGVKNYIANNQAEVNTTGWSTYADAAGVLPVDGTGGSATITLTRSTSSPLRGQASFLITKDAANRQGEGVSYDFTIDAADKYQPQVFSMDYAIASGTYADDDMIAYIYDVTNAALIQPVPYKIKNHSLPSERFQFEFQATDSTSYRLIFHVASTSASAYSLKIDNLSLGPNARASASIVTDPIAYTPTMGSFGNGVGYLAWERRGARVKIQGTLIVGATLPTGVFTFNLPTGMAADYSSMPKGVLNTDGYQNVGVVQTYAGTKNFTGKIIRAGSSTNQFQIHGDGTTYGGAGDWQATVPVTFAAGDAITVDMEVPILGWSSSSQIIDDGYAGRVVAANYTGIATGTLNGSWNTVTFPTKTSDTVGAYSSGTYTIKSSGSYDIGAAVNVAATFAVGKYVGIAVAIDGVRVRELYSYTGGANTNQTATISIESYPLIAGQLVTIQVVTDATTPTYTAAASVHNFSISKLSGSPTVLASESVNAKYFNNAGTSIANNTSTIVDFATKSFDSHNAWTTGVSAKFTAPISGVYEVSATTLLNAYTGWADGEALELDLYKNGVVDSLLFYDNVLGSASNINKTASGTTLVRLLAGEYFDIRLTQQSGAAITLAAAGYNHINIKRVGNY